MFSLAVLITCHFWDSVRLGFLYILNFYLGGGFRLWELSATTRWLGPLALGQVCLFGGMGSSWVCRCGVGQKKTILHSFLSLWVFTPGHGVLSLVFMTFLFCFASYTHFLLCSIFITYSIYLLSYIHTCNCCG